MKLKEYIRGERRGRDARRIELEAMRDPFLDDALEGFDSVDGDHAQALRRLSARLDEKTAGSRSLSPGPAPVWRRPALWLSVAALLVCGVFSTVLYRMTRLDSLPVADLMITDSTSKETSRGAAPPAAPADSAGTVTASEEFTESVPVPPVITDVLMTVGDDHRIEISDMEDAFMEFQLPAESAQKADAAPASPARSEMAAESVTRVEPDRRETSSKPAPTGSRKPSAGGEVTVRGRVVDEQGEPLPGVVVLADKSKGTVTDFDGGFTITVPQGQTLKARMLGYEDHDVNVGSRTDVVIAMRESSSQLDEVVVIGYGTRRKQAITGSVATTIQADEIAKKQSRRQLREESKSREILSQEPLHEDTYPARAYPRGGNMVAVGAYPVSSFGPDVRSDSYGYVRGCVNRGVMPSPGDVRTEEMINYFPYRYPEPQGREALAVSCEVGECPWNSSNLLVAVTIRAARPETEYAAEQVNVQVGFSRSVKNYRLLGYDNPSAGEGTNYRLRSGQSVTALYEIEGNAHGEILTVDVDYKTPGAKRTKNIKTTVANTGAQASSELRFAAAVAMYSELLRGSVFTEGVDFERVIDLASSALGPNPSDRRTQFLNLVRLTADIAEQE